MTNNTIDASKQLQKKPKTISHLSLKKNIVIHLSSQLKVQKMNALGSNYFNCHVKKWVGKSLLNLIKANPEIGTAPLKSQIRLYFPHLNLPHTVHNNVSKKNAIAIYWHIARIAFSKKKHKKLALVGHLLTVTPAPIAQAPLFSHFPAYYFWKDTTHTYTGCTHAYCTLHQLTHITDIQGKTDADLYPSHIAQQIKSIEKEALQQKKSIQDRDIICYLNDQQYHFSLTIIPIRYTHSKLKKTFLLGQLLRQNNPNLHATHTKTMAQYAQKCCPPFTAILTEEHDTVNQAKFNFLAAISHNLRTPLNSIIFSSQLLQAMPYSEEQSEFIMAILKSSQKLLCSIEDILNFSKIETGELNLNMDRFDLRKVIEDIISLENHKTHAKGVDLILCYSEFIPRHIVSDAFYIKRILINLIENAIQFTHQGHILIKVEGIRHSQYKANISILVQDTGIGIPQDQLENIFEHFTLIEPAYKKTELSAGLGLSVVQALVKKLEGTISVKSHSGKGAAFTIHLPISLQDTVTRYSTFYRHYTHCRLLIIDDNTLRGQVILEQTGLTNGKMIRSNQAIAEIDQYQTKKAPYQIILIDDDIQSIDPLELAKYISKQPEFKTTMLIYASKPGSFSKMNKATLAGFFRQIHKPIKPSKLISTLGNGWSHWLVKTKNHESLFKTLEPTLLVIAKEALVQQIIAVIYHNIHCKVETSRHYRMPINEATKEGSHDAILIDIDGMERETLSLIHVIRHKEDSSNPLPIIIITAHLSLRQEKKLKERGVTHFISKPLDPTEAKQTLLDSLFTN